MQSFETFDAWWQSITPTIDAAMRRSDDFDEAKAPGMLENIRVVAEDAWVHGGLSFAEHIAGGRIVVTRSGQPN